MLESAAKSAGDGYPPYNIERIAEADGSEHLRIVLAVAGFSPDELDVTVEDNQVIIAGKQREDNSSEFLHRGIAARQFKRAFVLAEGIEVTGADLENGLLSIELLRRAPERIIRKIEISSSDNDGGKVK